VLLLALMTRRVLLSVMLLAAPVPAVAQQQLESLWYARTESIPAFLAHADQIGIV